MRFPFRSLSLATGLLCAAPAPLLAAPATPPKATAPLVSGLDDLKQLDRKLVKMADQAAAATVSLISSKGGAAGSGVIVDADGTILSAGHVLASLEGEISVLFSDGKRATATPLGADFDRDSAAFKINEPGPYPHVELADPEPMPTNAWCVALGHPGGFDPLRTPPLRLGRVIANQEFIITDCTVVSGDSGGPLFDTEGRVIGIHSNIGSSLGENRHVPIKVYRDGWDDLLKGKRTGSKFNKKPGEKKAERDKGTPAAPATPAKPTLGLKLGAASAAGITVDEVAKDSPAAKAGLKSGDVIVRAAGNKVASAAEFADALAKRKDRPKLPLAYRRDGKISRVKIPMPAQSAEPPKPAAAEDDLGAYLDKALADAKDGKVELKLTPELVEKFGGMDRIQEEIKKRLEARKLAKSKAETKDETKESAPKPAADDDLGSYLDKALGDAKDGKAELKLTPELVEKFGGMARIQDEVRKRMEAKGQGKPRIETRDLTKSGPFAPDDFFMSVTGALKPVVKEGSASTVTVLVDGKPAALGTVVTTDGGILTKDSETAKGAVTVRAAGGSYPATLVKRFPEWDLALFAIPADGLRPIRFDRSSGDPQRASLLTVPGPATEPLGIGMVSVNSRPLARIGFLGIEAERTSREGDGVVVKAAIKDGPADKAGIKPDDVITAINGNPVSDAIDFRQTIVRFKTGETVKFALRRGEEKQTVEVKLGERPLPKISKDFLKVNEMSGPLSTRIDGFPLVLQHDIPLEPSQCGGPLLDLDGRCVGLNVSRAGRVNTLAVPARKIAELLDGARGDLAAARERAAASDQVTAEEIAEVTKALENLQERLKRLEKRLKPVPAPAR